MSTTDAATGPCDRYAVQIAAGAVALEERRSEAVGWHAFHSFVDELTPAEILTPGYYAEGWSVRDLVGHVGAWLAEGGLLLEQMVAGTYVEGELDVDAANERFFDLMRDLPFDTIRLQAWASRWRLVDTLAQLSNPPPEAGRWLAKAGGNHYAEHLPRLAEWCDELMARRVGAGASEGAGGGRRA